jgi:hypothetical protein
MRGAVHPVVKAVADVTGVNPLSICGERRDADALRARCMVAVRMRIDGASLKQIGRAIHRDHSSVKNLLDRADALLGEAPWGARMKRLSRAQIGDPEPNGKFLDAVARFAVEHPDAALVLEQAIRMDPAVAAARIARAFATPALRRAA